MASPKESWELSFGEGAEFSFLQIDIFLCTISLALIILEVSALTTELSHRGSSSEFYAAFPSKCVLCISSREVGSLAAFVTSCPLVLFLPHV